MTQTINRIEDIEDKKKKKSSKFDNLFLDALYNIIAYIPAAIITWFITQLE